MRISRFVLNNIGPYVDKNEFIFNIDNIDKNVVLIGGKNGGGKTTFFNALKIAMYGPRAFGYEGVSSKYVTKLKEIINTNVSYINGKTAGITLDLYFEDDIYKPIYTIDRSWLFTVNSITEQCSIFKNGELLDDISKNDFELYLYNLMSPKLFNFYFFDGEHIGEYFLDNSRENNFKNSFLQLAGLDNISYMIKNFNRLALKKNKDTKIAKEYSEQKKIFDAAVTVMKMHEDCLKGTQQSIKEIEDEIIACEKQYYSKGRVSAKEWKEINIKLAEEENKRAQIYKQQKDLANTHLPFIIMEKQLRKVVSRLESAEESSNKKICIDELNDINFIEFLRSEGIKSPERVLENLKGFMGYEETVEDIFGLSRLESKEVRNKIITKLENSMADIDSLNKQISLSLSVSKELRAKLANSDENVIAEFESTIEELKSRKALYESTLDLTNDRYLKSKVDCEYKELLFQKTKLQYEEELKSKSVSNVVNKAVLAFGGFEDLIIKDQTKKVEKAFSAIFNKIINKKGFIDGIKIDDDLNVHPYYYQVYDVAEIQTLLEKHSVGVVAKSLALINEEDLLNIPNIGKIKLKVENTKVFSKGERQVFIMSLYLALMSLKPVSLPFIIDTPFARIDAEHRSNIINYFFKKLSGQVFILSTDEEIVGKSEKELEDSVSDKYLLSFKESGKTEVCANKYFGV